MLTIKSESFISDKGKREINEDYLIHHPNKFYAVLDGVGGNGNGEIASKLVGETAEDLLLNSKSILEAVYEAEKKLSSFKRKNPSTERMATTIAVAEILENSIQVSWAGDSRVYQFRDGKIIFKTTDHTWVVKAVKKGVLSSVEALLKSKSITKATEKAEKKLSSYKKKNPFTEYMSTTIAVAEILDNSILVFWAGDSRVYQFRDGKIVFKTSDHSFVAEAVKKGILSSVEALFHPRANELTKSIKDSSKPVKSEQVLIDDIQPNDYFLICSDGITETWIDSDLEVLFSSLDSSNDIASKLKKECEIYSDDNYTAIVFQIN